MVLTEGSERDIMERILNVRLPETTCRNLLTLLNALKGLTLFGPQYSATIDRVTKALKEALKSGKTT